MDNFRFTKAEDIMFALEMDGEYVFNMLCKKINEKPFTKANEHTSILEVIAAVILRCFEKNIVQQLGTSFFLKRQKSWQENPIIIDGE